MLDGENVRIVKVNAFNVIERNFGSLDAGAERLINPAQIILDASDRIYVLDGDAIKMFDIYGNPTGTLPPFYPLPVHGIAASGNTLFILSDSTLTTFSPNAAEQNTTELHLPEIHEWCALAVSAKSIALIDEHAAYLYGR